MCVIKILYQTRSSNYYNIIGIYILYTVYMYRRKCYENRGRVITV